jgi:hypothetical protein
LFGECLDVAQSGRAVGQPKCPLLGVVRTSPALRAHRITATDDSGSITTTAGSGRQQRELAAPSPHRRHSIGQRRHDRASITARTGAASRHRGISTRRQAGKIGPQWAEVGRAPSSSAITTTTTRTITAMISDPR